jgi:hypothetical protein
MVIGITSYDKVILAVSPVNAIRLRDALSSALHSGGNDKEDKRRWMTGARGNI